MIQHIFVVKVNLSIWGRKIIYFFNFPLNILKRFLILIKLQCGNLMDYPMKELNLLQHQVLISIYIYNVKIRVKSHGSCLKQDKLLIDHKTVLDFYFLHEINLWLCNFAIYFALGNSFSAESNKNVHPYKPFYSGYVTGWMHVKLSSGCVTGWKHMKLSRFLMVLGLVVKT